MRLRIILVLLIILHGCATISYEDRRVQWRRCMGSWESPADWIERCSAG